MTYVKVFPPSQRTGKGEGPSPFLGPEEFEGVVGEVVTRFGAEVLIVPLPCKERDGRKGSNMTARAVAEAYPAWASWLKTLARTDQGEVGTLGPIWVGTPSKGRQVRDIPALGTTEPSDDDEREVVIVIAWTKKKASEPTSEATVRAILGKVALFLSKATLGAKRRTSVALPAIGCNTSGLDWWDVGEWTREALKGFPGTIYFAI